MGVVTCEVYALDTTLAHDPIEGVLLRIFDETGASFITSATTDALGRAQFDVNGTPAPYPIRYQVRCSKLGVTFTNPEYIEVYDPLPPATANSYNVYGDIHVLEEATKPGFCRCAGFFVDPGGRPIEDLMIKFTNLFEPVIYDNVVIATKVEVRTDRDGYAVVELVRGGKYVATISGMHDERLDIVVPDLPSANLKDVLYPVVASVTFSPAAPWSMLVGGYIDVTPVVTASSGAILDGIADGDVQYRTADPTVAHVAMGNGVLRISGVSAGSTTLILSRIDDSIKRIPDPAIIGSGGAISVA
jgi:hypothetical protein